MEIVFNPIGFVHSPFTDTWPNHHGSRKGQPAPPDRLNCCKNMPPVLKGLEDFFSYYCFVPSPPGKRI